MRGFLTFLIILITVFPVHAQEDRVTTSAIAYGQVVEDTLTVESFYDHWIFNGSEGDAVLIRMAAADGLAPLIGVIDAGGDLLARSDAMPDGTLVDAPVNGVAELRFTLPESGQYTIIATRVGNADGITTGSYKLSLIEEEVPATRDLQDVVFRCDEYEITTAATIEFSGEGDDGAYYRITVYGLDGFQPYIRVTVPFEQGVTDCTSDGSKTIGDEYTLDNRATVTVSEGSPYTAQHILTGMEALGQLTLVIGSRNGEPGRYVAVIEGLSINTPGDVDRMNVRLGPLAAETEMFLYMVRDSSTRIDPQMRMEAENPVIDFICDDAGRFDCADIPAATLYQVTMQDGVMVSGGRLDAGIRIATGNPDRVTVQFRSRSDTTSGAYAVLMIGELP
jgi:hypothetical protein